MGVEHPNAIILIVTADRAIQLQREVRKTGINGFCPKDKVSCLLTAIRALARGQTYFHFREPAQATA
jgi:DNA-binding NarL/FixJ family response regulator